MPIVTVAMKVGSGCQFVLNALTFVPELVNEVEASCRASLVRVRTWSRRPVERASYESERGRGVSFTVSASPVGFVFLNR
jgi:hypothetical protein